MTKIDYIGQLLIGRENNSRENNIITIAGINSNFQRLQEKVAGPNGYKDEIVKEETLVIIKLAYINIMATIYKMYEGRIPEAYEEFDKSELKHTVVEEEKSLKNEIISDEEENAENRRKNNEYKKLLISQRAPIQEVRRKYLEYLKAATTMIDEQIRRGNFDLEKNKKQEKIIREKARAFELLSDPDYKMRLDDLLLFNFSPNQGELYIPRYVTEVTYMPQRPRKERDEVTGEEYQTLNSLKFGDISAGDTSETIAIHVGNIGFGRYRQPGSGDVTYRDPEKVKVYIVLKSYRDRALAAKRKEIALKPDSLSRWDMQTDSEIFLVAGDLREDLLKRPDIDPAFIMYTQDVLLSTTNLEVASQYNGGYIGEIGLTQNRDDYTVIYDKEALCVSREFQNAGRIAGQIDGIETKAVIYKLDKGSVEIYDRNPNTGKLDKRTAVEPKRSTNKVKNIIDIKSQNNKPAKSNGER